MPYVGPQPATGENNSFRILDDISSYTLTFNPQTAVDTSASAESITESEHRFIQGQKVTYTNGGGSDIGGLTNNTSYYIIKDDKNTIKLASSASNAASATAINLTSKGSGTAHTLNVAFDGVNTKFLASYDGGTKVQMTRGAQLQVSMNGIMQQPFDHASPTSGFGMDLDSVIVMSSAPSSTDAFWGHIVANNFPTFDGSDNKIDNFTGDNSTVNFTLSKVPPDNRNILVTIDGVIQYPDDPNGTSRAYSLVNNVITFAAAPALGVEIQVRHIGYAGPTSGSGGVTSWHGRSGAVAIKDTDAVVGVYSGGTGIGTVRKLNFIGSGNTFFHNSTTNTVDISITGAGGTFKHYNAGIATSRNVLGINTSNLDVVGMDTSAGVYISNGMLYYDNALYGNHNISTAHNGLMAGPVTIHNTLTVDGNYVVV